MTCSLFDATGIDRRAVWNAARLMKNCEKVKDPEPGDLCFYGSSWASVTHVMIYIGETKKRPEGVPATARVYGSSGGDRRTLNPEIAAKMNAKVTSYKTHMYRRDFLGFGRLATNDQ